MSRKDLHCGDTSCREIAETCVAFNLRRASRVVSQLYAWQMKDLGIKSTQFTLLTAVRDMAPVSITELASVMVMDRTTLTRNLKPLINAGYLKVAEGNDRRRRLISITASGTRLHDNAISRWQQAQQQMMDYFGQAAINQLISDLTHMVEGVAGMQGEDHAGHQA